MASTPPPGYAAYPRGNGYYPPPLSLDILGEAWRVLNTDVGNWILNSFILALCFTPISFVSSFISSFIAYGSVTARPNPQNPFGPQFFVQLGTSSLFNILLMGLFYVMIGGFLDYAVKRIQGQPADTSHLFGGFKYFKDLYIVGTVTYLLSLIGYMFCIVPGVIVLGLLSIAPLLVVRDGLSAIDALKKSYELLSGQLWLVTGLMFLGWLMAMVGVFLCCIGIFYTMPLFYIVQALIYCAVVPPQQSAVPNPYESPPSTAG